MIFLEHVFTLAQRFALIILNFPLLEEGPIKTTFIHSFLQWTQLMQDIVIKRNALVFWLDDASENLQTFLENWAENYFDLDDFVFVFLDDFNAPRTRDIIDYAPIARLLRSPKFDRVKWPVLVTCSPPEYLEEFKATGSDEGFRVRKWLIPPMTKGEQLALLEWYQNRTGETPKTGAAFEQAEGLVLSMMFELRYGDMKEFGKRFEARLRGSGLLEAMAQPLALNRLYIWPPKSWIDALPPAQKDALAALNIDQDFSVLSTESQTGEYIRLTHPHLSNVIYKAMRPDSAGYQRAEDLSKVFERALLTNDILASRILRIIANGGERISEINPEELAKETTNAWNKNAETVKQLPPKSLAFFWINWSRWASRTPQIGSLLPDSPIDKAVEFLSGPHWFWGILWQSIWADKPGHPKLINLARIWLNDSNNREDPSWSHVWGSLLKNASQLPTGTTAADLLDMGLHWLNQREDRPEWSHVWETLLKHPDQLPPETSPTNLLQTGLDWLHGYEDCSQWSFVWQSIHQYQSSLPTQHSLNELIDTGIQWLSKHEDHESWAFVWELILEHKDQLSNERRFGLFHTGLTWLEGRDIHPSWSFVYENCLRAGIKNKVLLSKGVEWILNNTSRPETYGIALEIAKNLHNLSVDDRERLTEWLNHWLASNHCHPSWTYGWSAYWSLSSISEATEMALDWIEACPSRIGSVTWIIATLAETRQGDIIKKIQDWHQNHVNHPMASVVINALERVIGRTQ